MSVILLYQWLDGKPEGSDIVAKEEEMGGVNMFDRRSDESRYSRAPRGEAAAKRRKLKESGESHRARVSCAFAIWRRKYQRENNGGSGGRAGGRRRQQAASVADEAYLINIGVASAEEDIE